MKKLLLVLVLPLMLSLEVKAQWVTSPGSNSGTHSEVFRLNVIDANALWAMDFGRMVYRTVDGGSTWNLIDLNAKFPGKTVYGFTGSDANTAWAAVQDFFAPSPGRCDLYKTSDGGNTWVNQVGALPTNYMVHPNLIHFFDSNNGVIISSSPLEARVTSDGGMTWTLVPTANFPTIPSINNYVAYYNYCVVGNNIWVIAGAMRIYRSTDKGLTWTVYDTGIPFSGLGQNVTNVAFTDANNGIVNFVDDFRRTTDGGLTWTPFIPSGAFRTGFIRNIPGVTGGYLAANAEPRSTSTFTLGSAFSLDHGNSWQNIENSFNHRSLAFSSLTEGWAGGEGFLRKFNNTLLSAGLAQGQINKFTISPNPSTGIFTISFAANQVFRVEVYNLTGTMIMQQHSSLLGNTQLDLSSQPKGLYLVKLFDRGQVTTRRLLLN